jgi:HAD superfamily phosphatase (TIGR01668 family)
MIQNGIRVCLLSNNWHRSVFAQRDELGLPLVRRAMKPLPFAFIRARRKLGARSRQTIVVGDQLITDVLGAKWAGMQVVWVDPLSSTDLWYTKIFRRIERRYLAHLGKPASRPGGPRQGSPQPPDAKAS